MISTFSIEVSIYSFFNRCMVMRLDKMERNNFPSTLRRDIVLNCLISVESSSFGAKIPSDVSQLSATFPLRHITLKIANNRYGTPFGPGADAALAFFITSRIALEAPSRMVLSALVEISLWRSGVVHDLFLDRCG